MAYASLQMGHTYRLAGDYDNAVASYDRSIQLYERAGTSAHLYQALKGRLLTYIARGDDRSIQEEISKVVGMVESYRDKIFEDDNRRTFFDAEQNIYDLAIGFTYSRLNAHERALGYSESSHARAILDLVNSDRRVLGDSLDPNVIFKGATRPLPLDEIRRRLPEPIQVLQYSLLRDVLLIWVISRDGVASVAVQIPQKELEEKVGAYLRLLSSSSEEGGELPGLARELHDSLIKPVEPLLDRRKQVYVVPDKILNLLPFGALVSGRSGRYMIEDYVLALAPSSTMLVACTEIARGKGGGEAEKILSVGNPRFDRGLYPSLPDLPSAAREAATSAAYYNTRRVLLGDEPSPGRIVGEMRDSDVIHLALHSILDERFPLRSKFLLAGARADADRAETHGSALFAYELYGLRLPRTRLAVLSACQTGSGRYFGGEGVINMARPFIAAGVPLVVASLWPIDSGPTAELMIRFHELRKVEGLPTAEALRLAQIDMLRGSEERLRRPYYWAPFVLIGGYAEF
jgi:CHAT domain-containing protein